MACTPSTQCRAPTSWARSATRQTGVRVPIRFEAPVVATSRVRSESTAATASADSSPVAGSKSTHRTVAPTASAACTQGRMFASWSSRVTTTSSPGPQSLASAAGEVVGERGGAAAEHDAARVGPEQVGEGGAAVGDDLLGAPLGGGDRAAVRDRAGQGVGDRPADDVGGLAAAGAVEVRGPLGERGEVGTDRGDVERHTGILPHAVDEGASVTRRCAAGAPRRSRRCSGCRPSPARGTPPGCARPA